MIRGGPDLGRVYSRARIDDWAPRSLVPRLQIRSFVRQELLRGLPAKSLGKLVGLNSRCLP